MNSRIVLQAAGRAQAWGLAKLASTALIRHRFQLVRGDELHSTSMLNLTACFLLQGGPRARIQNFWLDKFWKAFLACHADTEGTPEPPQSHHISVHGITRGSSRKAVPSGTRRHGELPPARGARDRFGAGQGPLAPMQPHAVMPWRMHAQQPGALQVAAAAEPLPR